MKLPLITLATSFALALSAVAENYSAKISDVHLCCGKCVTKAEKVVNSVEGVKGTADKDAGTVVITAPDKATAQKAADALVGAGFFGSSDQVALDATTGARNVKVQSLEIKGVHLCCAKCVKAVDKALKNVPGVTSHTGAPGDESFTVTGDFIDKDVFDALQKAGLTGKTGN
jgi:copper chaperone CopZ